MSCTEVGRLNLRIQELEEKVEYLRFSRRVLMGLVEELNHEKWSQVSRLEKENQRLQRSNAHFARLLLEKNRKILELEEQLAARNQPSQV